MWSGGISGRNRVRPAGKRASGQTCQTAKPPACHVQFVNGWFFIHGQFVNSIKISFSEQKFQITTSHFNFFLPQKVKVACGLQVTNGGLPRRNVSFAIPDLCRWRKTWSTKLSANFFNSSSDSNRPRNQTVK